MKAIIPKSQLVEHAKVLKTANPRKRKLDPGPITLSASDRLLISGVGFEQEIECTVLRAGKVILPYVIWNRLLQGLKIEIGDEITIAGEEGLIIWNRAQIRHDDIETTYEETLAPEIPLNASSSDIIKLVFLHGPERFKASGLWHNRVRAAVNQLRKDLRRATSALKEYNVPAEDLARCVAEKLEIDDYDTFAELIFEEDFKPL